jgi:hypothetical protein
MDNPARFVAQIALFLVALLIAFAVVVGGCMAFGVLSYVNEPVFRMDLPGTRWAIDAIDDQQIDPPVLLAFDDDVDAATLTLPCGEVWLAWAWDSDGSAQSFGINRLPEACADADVDRAALDALLAVEEWAIDDDDRITMRGPQILYLSRLPN